MTTVSCSGCRGGVAALGGVAEGPSVDLDGLAGVFSRSLVGAFVDKPENRFLIVPNSPNRDPPRPFVSARPSDRTPSGIDTDVCLGAMSGGARRAPVNVAGNGRVLAPAT